ncbi:hypothetical protein AM501_03455 [Aneurinibacillus migulanus]|uniref:hypothetical protein n=1 Tax=Aneurinibacillus migulanus TaxID=47500 RepID=UPI0005BAFC78|nr:hypothetical protein [Aneurinibacillus migulanus]KIV55074.1 hypothetical protein TS64_12430 [Aneurinibacillus migulanus]KPD09581.1 hypothetical protein AM501_03455 [Aneurinibacillus migulanus]
MNWDNINKILDKYTQYKHYHLLFEKHGWKKRASREDMAKTLYEAVNDRGFLEPALSEEAFDEWFALHQIDGNNYTFVYNLTEKADQNLLLNLYNQRHNLIKKKLWEFNPDNQSEDLDSVIPGLTSLNLIGIHRNIVKGTYTFSFIAPCQVWGRKVDSSTRIFKKIFFAHCVLFDDSNDCKVIFNPTSNLINVNGVEREKRRNWTPIASMFFEELKKYIGSHFIKAPLWIPNALYKLAEEATGHNNPTVTEFSFNAQDKIEKFASSILADAGISHESDQALVARLIQDIQQSYESQLVERYGVIEDNEESFELFRQRSDGLVHSINVETHRDGMRVGAAAEAARRSRAGSDIDLLGVILKTGGCMHKFLVEQGTEAYLIRGTGTFIEEGVVDIVVRKLNVYREEIQSSEYSCEPSTKGANLPPSQ